MTEPNFNSAPDDPQEDQSWKNAVASRLDTYRTKSKRKLTGNFSMRFNFEGEIAGPRQQICVPDSVIPEPEPFLQEPETLTAAVVPEPEPEPPKPAPLRPSVPFKRKIVMEANVIEFPRLFPPEPPPASRVAEPVLPTTPRILDAPEIAEPLLENPILEGMRLEHLAPSKAPALELPLQVAPLTDRALSALADCAIVAAASGIFLVIADKMMPGLEWTKPVVSVLGVLPVLLWGLYQYLFILYGARTPGMAISRLAFSTFDGTAPNLRQRRMRLMGIALSCCSLMLGFVWACFDEDMLCWHDRISRTYCFRQHS